MPRRALGKTYKELPGGLNRLHSRGDALIEHSRPRHEHWAYYEKCGDLAGPYRWWRSDWPGDAFDIITEEELQKRLGACEILGLPVREGLPAFEPDHEFVPDRERLSAKGEPICDECGGLESANVHAWRAHLKSARIHE